MLTIACTFVVLLQYTSLNGAAAAAQPCDGNIAVDMLKSFAVDLHKSQEVIKKLESELKESRKELEAKIVDSGKELEAKIVDSRWESVHRDVMAVCTQHTWSQSNYMGSDYVMPLKRRQNCQQRCKEGSASGICFGQVQLFAATKQLYDGSRVATSYIFNTEYSCEYPYDRKDESEENFEEEAPPESPNSRYCCCGLQ